MNKQVRGVEGSRQPESSCMRLGEKHPPQVDDALTPASEGFRASWHLLQGRTGCSMVIF